MVHLIPTLDTLTAQGFAQLMQDNIFKLHGLPLDIIHDRDPRFTGQFFKQVCEILGIHQSQTSAWHPQSDGQTERMNRTIEQVMRAHSASSEKEWDETLSMVEFAMNNSKHASLQKTPFFLNYGTDPLTPLMVEVIKHNKTCAAAVQFTESRKQAFEYAMRQLTVARDRYKSYKDLNRKDTQYNIGEKVLLSTTNINRHGQKDKLFPTFIGPFDIIDKVNDAAYKLQLPDNLKIHNVFHVSLLQPYRSNRYQPPPLPIDVDGELEYEVEQILFHRDKKHKRGTSREYYIKWLGFGPEHCTWESEASVKNAKELVDEYWQNQERLKIATDKRMQTRQANKNSRYQPDTTASKRHRMS